MLKLIRSNLTLVTSFYLQDSINSFHLLNSIAHYQKYFKKESQNKFTKCPACVMLLQESPVKWAKRGREREKKEEEL